MESELLKQIIRRDDIAVTLENLINVQVFVDALTSEQQENIIQQAGKTEC